MEAPAPQTSGPEKAWKVKKEQLDFTETPAAVQVNTSSYYFIL